jgi:hypothetical protein
VRRAAGHDEHGKAPEHPTEDDIASPHHEVGECAGDGEVGERDQCIGDGVRPDEFRAPEKADAVRREAAALLKLAKEAEHRGSLPADPLSCSSAIGFGANPRSEERSVTPIERSRRDDRRREESNFEHRRLDKLVAA